MESAYLVSTEEALARFQVKEQEGLSDSQIQQAIVRYGRNGGVARVFHTISNLTF